MRLLLGAGTDLEIAAGDESTPLQAAVHRGHEETVGLLLRWGTEVTAAILHRGGIISMARERAKFGARAKLWDYP